MSEHRNNYSCQINKVKFKINISACPFLVFPAPICLVSGGVRLCFVQIFFFLSSSCNKGECIYLLLQSTAKSGHTVTDSAHNCLNQRSQLTGWTERAETWLGESKELRKNPPRRRSPRQKRRLLLTKICATVKKRIVTLLMRLTQSLAGRDSILLLLLRKMATNMDTRCSRRSRSRMGT